MRSLKIKSKKISKKTSLIIVAALAVVLIALACYVFLFKGSLFGWSPYSTDASTGINHGTDYKAPTNAQIKEGDQIKSNSLNDKSKTGSSGSDQPPAPTPTSNGKSSVGVTITATNQTNDAFQIRTLISALDDGGTCTLTISKSGHTTVIQTAGVQNLSSTSTCKGFDVPLANLAQGDWNVTISYSSSTLAGSVSKTVSVQ